MKVSRFLRYLGSFSPDAGIYRNRRKENPVNYIIVRDGNVYLGDIKDADSGSPLSVSVVMEFLGRHTEGKEEILMDTGNPVSALAVEDMGDDGILVLCEDDDLLHDYLETVLSGIPDREEECYRKLLEDGIGFSVVKKVLGKEPSEKMRAFCKEYGL